MAYKRCEWHLLGNHLFSNAKALIYAGIYFEGIEAQRWLDYGMSILSKQIEEQILSDGGHFELSPMYHSLAVEDVLDLVNLCRANSKKLSAFQIKQLEDWQNIVPKMLYWLKAVSHPDEKISFFNDSAFKIAPENSEIFCYADRLGFKSDKPKNGITHLQGSGLLRLQDDKFVVIVDFAEIGASYNPGHAHADTLSFELSFCGQRLFVNSGTSLYQNGHERLRQRSTVAHNTVCLQNKNSSQIWSSFRVADRAKIINLKIDNNELVKSISATHDGYYKIIKGPLHERKISLSKNEFRIIDQLSKPSEASARFYFHPDVIPSIIGNNSGEILMKYGQKLKFNFEDVSDLSIIETTWHPEFGVSIPNKCLIATFHNQSSKFKLIW